MSEKQETIKIELTLPSGQHQDVTAPVNANIQQLIDSLVTRLSLPVIRDDGTAIHYRLDDAGTKTPLNALQTVQESGLVDGSHLFLIPHDGSGLIFSLPAPVSKLPATPAADQASDETAQSGIRGLLLDAGFWQSVIALIGGLLIIILSYRLRNILFGLTGLILAFAATSYIIHKMGRYSIF